MYHASKFLRYRLYKFCIFRTWDGKAYGINFDIFIF